jgi:YjbE family integral membrane protein
MMSWMQTDLLNLLNVIMIDVVLAGDNAIVVGMAASRVAPAMRPRVLFWGIAGAVVLRILTIVGLTLAGGVLLLWVSWKMYRQLMAAGDHDPDAAELAQNSPATLTFRQAVTQVIVADVTMSLDNVLAVAGAAKGSFWVLTVGLIIGIVLMALASHAIARLLVRFPWVTWIGLAIVAFVAVSMIWDGWHQIGREYPRLSIDALLGAVRR